MLFISGSGGFGVQRGEIDVWVWVGTWMEGGFGVVW